MQTKEEFMNYLKEAIEYYKTEEYQSEAKKFKDEAAGIKDIYKRQEIWDKYLDPAKNKIGELFIKYKTDKFQIMDLNMKFSNESDVIALVMEMAKVAAF